MEQSKFYQIKNITEQEYTLVGCDGSVITRPIQDVDKSASVFTIQDAKDGDVLDANGAPFIYKKHDKDCVYFYCGVNLAGEFIEANWTDIWNSNNKVYPATKEQRDLLFQKMHEKGYEWDTEKKELEKIEQKPSEWSEEDEKMINNIINMIGFDSNRNVIEGNQIYVNWLQSLKDRVQPQPKQEWSEEDIEMIDYVASILNSNFNENDKFDDNKPCVGALVDRLKSLRPQNKWKPSDMELEVLRLAAEKDGTCLMGLYEQLKKLKG